MSTRLNHEDGRGNAAQAATAHTQLDMFGGEVDPREVELASFRKTRYATIAPLLNALDLPVGLWCEFCAGDGALIRHVERWLTLTGQPGRIRWHAVELRRSPELRATVDGALVWDGTDFREWNGVPGVLPWGWILPDVFITNLPWPGWEPLVQHAMDLNPQAHIVGLSSVGVMLDGDRPAWHQAHMADLYICNGRQRFPNPNKPSCKASYPGLVAWFHWPPGQHNRTHGTVSILDRHPEQ